MRLTADQLRDKALLALEDAVQECRYRQPRRSFLLRFALAYLWSISPHADRDPFDHFWESIGRPVSPWSFSATSVALTRIYFVLGLHRPGDVALDMWERWEGEERKEASSAPDAPPDHTAPTEAPAGAPETCG